MNNFTGAKGALFFGHKVLVYLRDEKPGLKFAGMWDFPGGGKEDTDESPEECLIRETREEFGIDLNEKTIEYRKSYPSETQPGGLGWFMAAHLDLSLVDQIEFGDEGQRWELWSVDEILNSARFVPFLKQRFRDYVARDIVSP